MPNFDLYFLLSTFASPAATINIGLSFTLKDNVLAISSGLHPNACAASSTVALDTSNSFISFSLLYFF